MKFKVTYLSTTVDSNLCSCTIDPVEYKKGINVIHSHDISIMDDQKFEILKRSRFW